MINVLGLLVWLVHQALGLLLILIIAYVVVANLVAFDVLNLRNRVAYAIYRALETATGWLLKPLRRVVPPIGGIDLTPLIPILVIPGLQIWITGPYLAEHPPTSLF